MTNEQIYQSNIHRALEEMYHRMVFELLDWIPEDGEGIDDSTFTDEQWETIWAVNAIEEEWLVDAEDRKALSVINWTEQ